MLNSFRRLFSSSQNRKARRAYPRPQLLQLEGRIVPANFQVTSLADTVASDSVITLREAITLANNTAGNDIINFSFGSGSSPYTITITTALPNIFDASTAGTLTITGLGSSSLTIDANQGNFGIFTIDTGGNLTISGVTVSGANISSGTGGGFNNFGTLTVSNSTISGNTVGDFGGGIYNNGALTVSNSTLSGNRANFGAGVFNNSNSTSTISNSTFSANKATTLGGGFNNFGTNGIVTLTNSTLSGNSARGTSDGGGIYNSGGCTLNIANTIIANSTVINSSSLINDYDGTGTVNLISPSTAANNLVSQGSFIWATTKTSAEINLGTLANNGGPTQTLALLNGSAAIGAGNATVSNASPVNGVDQRGFSRITSDIGAYAVSNLIQVTTTADTINPTDGVTSF